MIPHTKSTISDTVEARSDGPQSAHPYRSQRAKGGAPPEPPSTIDTQPGTRELRDWLVARVAERAVAILKEEQQRG